MVQYQCDSCGKIVIEQKDANIHFFTKYEFCSDCYRKLEAEWANAFHNCSHDLSMFLRKQVEIASTMTKGSSKDTVKAIPKAAPAVKAAKTSKTTKKKK